MVGKIDKVITKSIRRFATKHYGLLKLHQKAQGQNIPVYFEKENIDSMDSMDKIMLTIMVYLAQQ
jgi:DNA invertase Pin-like site-specific DNA recombinase